MWQLCAVNLSELIPCHDAELRTRLKLKIATNVMEHYERHCPPQQHRHKCRIPPPPGYQVGRVGILWGGWPQQTEQNKPVLKAARVLRLVPPPQCFVREAPPPSWLELGSLESLAQHAVNLR